MGITLNENDLKMLQTIRRIPGCTKSNLANKLHIPWSSAYSSINKLNNRIFVYDDFNAAKNSSYIPAGVYINQDFEYYVGISVGSSQLKVVILGYDFSVVDINTVYKDYLPILKNFHKNMIDPKHLGFSAKAENLCQWCVQTPCNTDLLRDMLIRICRDFKTLKENQIPIAAINFALPGHIDFYSQKIISTGHLCNSSNFIKNSSISGLITPSVYENLIEQNIMIFVDHNVKCSAFAEKEFRFVKSLMNSSLTDDDLIIAYLGRGFGISLITNNRLYRDVRNDAGQFGHVSVYYNGKKMTLQQIFTDEVLSKFENNKNPTAEELKEFLQNPENSKVKECLTKALAQAICDVIYIIGIEKIIFTGKLDCALEVLEFDLIREFEENGLFGIQLLNSAYGEYSAAIGAAMSCFNLLYGIDYVWY